MGAASVGNVTVAAIAALAPPPPWRALRGGCQDCALEPLQPLMATTDPRRQAMVDSLRSRYEEAEQQHDAEAKQALFKEAVYLGIQPEEFTQAS